jgi:hypothetical protein
VWGTLDGVFDADTMSQWFDPYHSDERGGEPDVVGHDKKTGEYISYDCSAESPEGRSKAGINHLTSWWNL